MRTARLYQAGKMMGAVAALLAEFMSILGFVALFGCSLGNELHL